MQVTKIGVLGAGTMGNGIAQAFASAGLDVIMCDRAPEALEKGMATVRKSLERLRDKGRLQAEEVENILARIRTETDIATFSNVDVAVEAATENLELKLALFRSLDGICKPEAILASNTSSISITRLAKETKRPGRVIGMHFFNPVPVMQLVEVVRAIQTEDEVYGIVEELARRIGKTPVVVKNSPGFVANRILLPMINEAVFALHEGLGTAEDIDTVMKLGANHPIGPLALADLIGLDTCLSILEVLYDNFNDSKYRPCPLLREMVDAGWLGRKTGRGFYTY